MIPPQPVATPSLPVIDIEVVDLIKTYAGRERPALGGVSFTVPRGQSVALMGASGSGKSTLLSLLGGLDAATSGTVTIRGMPLAGASDGQLTRLRRDVLGFVFQQFHLIPTLTALENVIAPMVGVVPRKQRGDKARQALTAVGLAGKEHQLPATLSGGEQQRVAIARALVLEPGVLLADEPTGNLDSATGTEVLALLKEIRSRISLTTVMATHDPFVAVKADRVIVLKDGLLVADLEVETGADVETLLRSASHTGDDSASGQR